MTKLEQYEDFCNKLDALFNKANFCNFQEGKCQLCKDRKNVDSSCCSVTNCSQLTATGCGTQNLMYKLTVCERINFKQFEGLKNQVEQLSVEIKDAGLYNETAIAMSKLDVLKKLKIVN